MYISNVILAVINIPLASQLVKVLKTPEKILLPLVVALGFIGTYALSFATTDFFIIALCGVIAYFVKKLNVPISSFILALILGSKIETSFRQSMVLSKGSMGIFASDSITIFFIILAVLSLFGPLVLNKMLSNNK